MQHRADREDQFVGGGVLDGQHKAEAHPVHQLGVAALAQPSESETDRTPTDRSWRSDAIAGTLNSLDDPKRGTRSQPGELAPRCHGILLELASVLLQAVDHQVLSDRRLTP